VGGGESVGDGRDLDPDLGLRRGGAEGAGPGVEFGLAMARGKEPCCGGLTRLDGG